jgi:hypothetical protein
LTAVVVSVAGGFATQAGNIRAAALPGAYSPSIMKIESRRGWVLAGAAVLAGIAAVYVVMDFVLTAISCGSASFCGGG